MPRHLFPALVLLLLPALAASADDPYGDPIPEGARARLGTARMRNTYGSTPSAMTSDGRHLVGVSAGGMGFYDPATGKVAFTVKPDGAFGTPVAFSADGKRAASVGYEGAFAWDAVSGKLLAKTARPATPGGDNAVSLSADGKRLAVGGTRRDKEKGPTAVVWDVDGNKPLASVAPVQNETAFVALAPDGQRLATWGYHYDRDAKGLPDPATDPSRVVQIWDAATGKETAKVRVPGGLNPAAVVFSPDGTLAAASPADGTVHLFDPATGAAKGLLLGRTRQGRRLAFSPDGKTLAAAGEDGSVQRWGVPDGKRLGTTESPVPVTFAPRGLQFVGADRVIAWGQRGSTTFAWEAPSGKLLTPAGGHAASVAGAAVAGGGAEFVTSAQDGGILRWNPATGKELGPIALKVPGYAVPGFGPAVALAPDGTRAMTPEGGSGGLAVYDLPAGTQQFVIPGEPGRDSRGSFSADGTRVVQVMTSFDAKKNPPRVAVWDVAAGKKLGGVELPGTSYPAAAVTPDGKTLVVAGTRTNDKGGAATFAVTGWEVATGKKLGEYAEPGDFGAGFVAAADNASAVVATPRGPVAVIDVTTGKKLRDLEAGKDGRGNAAALAVSPDGKTAAVLYQSGFGPDGTGGAVLADVASGKAKKTLAGITGSPTVAVFSPDGKTLLTGSTDTTVLVWDVAK